MKTYKYRFNTLLLQYNKCRRKLANLQTKNRNVRRQQLLKKRITQLYKKLTNLKQTIKLSAAATAAFVGLSLATPQAAQAQYFLSPQVNPFGLDTIPDGYFAFPTTVDLNDDGDIDILSGSYYSNFYYYDNIGSVSSPTFPAPVKNPFGLDTIPGGYLLFPTTADLDGDGDIDVLSGSVSGNIYYYKNTGTANSPAFATPVKNPFGLDTIPDGYFSFPIAVNLDDDGDIDILSGSYYSNFYYYENTGASGIENNKVADYKIYPNPVNNKLNIAGAKNITQVKIYSIDGRLIETVNPKENTGNISIDFEKYQKGMYLVKLYFKEGSVTINLIAK